MNLEVTTDIFYQLHTFFKFCIPFTGGMCVMWTMLALLDFFKGEKWPWVTALFFALALSASIILDVFLPGGTIYVNIL